MKLEFEGTVEELQLLINNRDIALDSLKSQIAKLSAEPLRFSRQGLAKAVLYGENTDVGLTPNQKDKLKKLIEEAFV